MIREITLALDGNAIQAFESADFPGLFVYDYFQTHQTNPEAQWCIYHQRTGVCLLWGPTKSSMIRAAVALSGLADWRDVHSPSDVNVWDCFKAIVKETGISLTTRSADGVTIELRDENGEQHAETEN